MKLKSEYVEKIENRCYESLMRLRYQTELHRISSDFNLDFALKTFRKDYEVDLLAETDPERIFLSLIKNLINLVCLEEDGDARLVLLDVFHAYLDFLGKNDAGI